MAFHYNSGFDRSRDGSLFPVGHKVAAGRTLDRPNFQNFVLAIISKQKRIMEYQVNVNYRFQAVNEKEAKEKAKQYIASSLKVQPMPAGVYSPLEVADQCWDFRKKEKEYFCVFLLNTLM